jgi:hypothetical protein
VPYKPGEETQPQGLGATEHGCGEARRDERLAGSGRLCLAKLRKADQTEEAFEMSCCTADPCLESVQTKGTCVSYPAP